MPHKDPERARQYFREYVREREQCDEAYKQRRRAAVRRSREKAKAQDPDAFRRRMKGYRLKTDHGISLEEFQQLTKQQNDRCAICNQPSDDLHVDHCHTNQHVRGLLCHSCNVGLGHFRDSVSILVKAIAYIKQHDSK